MRYLTYRNSGTAYKCPGQNAFWPCCHAPIPLDEVEDLGFFVLTIRQALRIVQNAGIMRELLSG
jgi:hypothetical protein